MPRKTSWKLIESAAAGRGGGRDAFARRYLPTVQRQLRQRWRHSRLRDDADDAVQEVFVECLREAGALQAAVRSRPARFAAFLAGVVRNVARRHEERSGRGLPRDAGQAEADAQPAADPGVSRAIDTHWARGVLARAMEHHAAWARDAGAAAQERLELVRLHLQEGEPMAGIARRQGRDVFQLHHLYSRGLGDFEASLRAILSARWPHASRGRLEELLEPLMRP